MASEQELLTTLSSGQVFRFADWPCGDVPNTGAIVYTIWNRKNEFIYVGMSGRQQANQTNSSGKRRGPWARLASHASGQRSGDQFCIYVCDRLVLSSLHNRISEIASGDLSLNVATRGYVKTNLGFRWAKMDSGRAALDLERKIQKGETICGKPLLNPI